MEIVYRCILIIYYLIESIIKERMSEKCIPLSLIPPMKSP